MTPSLEAFWWGLKAGICARLAYGGYTVVLFCVLLLYFLFFLNVLLPPLMAVCIFYDNLSRLLFFCPATQFFMLLYFIFLCIADAFMTFCAAVSGFCFVSLRFYCGIVFMLMSFIFYVSHLGAHLNTL